MHFNSIRRARLPRAAITRSRIASRALLSAAIVLGSLLPVASVSYAACTGNAIVCENQLPGTPISVWDVSGGTGDPSIQGFATDISVDAGQTVIFKISTPASAYHLDIYRIGYYQGNGARLITTVTPSASLPQTQPACLTDAPTGLIDCGNWAPSASWTVPSTAVSGIYLARAIRNDTGGASHIAFIVRNDASHSDILYQASDTTWQAYNNYGGNSLYVGGPGTNPGRAYKVSYNRPFFTRTAQGGLGNLSWIFGSEYPAIRWLEANGYDVSYSTATDTDRRGNLLLNHKTFLSVGHDEYWSGQERANVQAARDAGVNLAFLSGNEIFWKTRWENSIDGSNTSYRTLVSYKETHANAVIDPQDPPTWTGTWRDPRFSPPGDGGRPENALSGTIFMINCCPNATMNVSSAEGKLRFWRNTAWANLTAGQTATSASTVLGHEFDEDLDNGFRPAGLIDMSTTTMAVNSMLQDYGTNYGVGTAVHHITLYRAPSGARVFSAGTIQWAWALDANHDGTQSPVEPNIQQAMINLLADMGAQPGSIQPGMVAATASTDTTAPTSSVTSPTNGANVTQTASMTISGSATDAGGGAVGGVEVSLDGGTTWHPASGRGSWSYTFAPTSGPLTIKTRATDDSGNIETPGAGVSVTILSNAAPVITQAAATNVTGNAATITWTTDRIATSQVDWGTTNAYGSSTTLDSTLLTSHSQAIGPLNASTTYHFRLHSTDNNGHSTVSGDMTFNTAPAGQAVMAGDSTLQTNVDTTGAGNPEAFVTSASASGNASRIFVYLDASNQATSVTAGLYTNNAATNAPGTLLAQGTVTSPTNAAWNSITIPSTGLSAGTKYWIAIMSPNGNKTVAFRDVANGGPAIASSASNATTLAASWSSGASYANAPLSAYLTGTTDTVPPTVSMLAPSPGASVSGSITVSADAADNVGIASVQFLLDGANLGAADTSSPYTFSWDTTTTTNGSHTLSARAADAGGNTTTSSTVSVTVNNPLTISGITSSGITSTGATIKWTTNLPSTSQVLYGATTAYGSQTALDSNQVTSHTQALTGLQPSTTYHFQVQSKDAANNLVSSSDQTLTTLAPAPTILVGDPNVEAGQDETGAGNAEAFQYTASATGTTNQLFVFLDGQNAATSVVVGLYTNNASNNPGTLLGQATITAPSNNAWNSVTIPSVTITSGQVYWIAVLSPAGNHTVRFRDVASGGRAQASSVTTASTLPATWSPGSTYANSPMSAYVVQTGPADTTPPTVNLTAPTNGATVSGASVTVSANASDNIGVASVQFLLDGANLGSADTTTPYSMTWDTTTATNGSHSIAAKAFDGAGNNTTSTAVNVTVSNPPTISGISATGITSNGATIKWTTNAPASSQVFYGTTASYGSQTTLDSNLVTSHSQALTGLQPSTTYHYQVQSKDAANNVVTSSDQTFTTTAAAPTVLVGDSSVETSQDETGGGDAEAFQYTATTSGTATKVLVFLDGANAASKVIVGVYNNSSTNHPSTLLGQATINAPAANAWNTVTVPSVSITAGTKYWIAILSPNGSGTVRFRDVASGGLAESSTQTTLSTLTATWSTGGVWHNSPMSAYLTP